MTLIKSISGIRGTIGGSPGEGLTPVDIVKFTYAYASFLKIRLKKVKLKVLVGRDARISGEMVSGLVVSTLSSTGIDVIDAGLSTTPTIEVGVTSLNLDGGIIITASHNPKEWNALKLLNEKGEFLSASDGECILQKAEADDFYFSTVEKLGKVSVEPSLIDLHIQKVLALELVDIDLIRKSNFSVAIDAVNSTGGLAIPKLLKALGVKVVHELFCVPDGKFPHNPEPLPENLNEISGLVAKEGVDVGFVVDPDVDRLAIVDENGEMFGEEYTLVAVADFILQHAKGPAVSNQSSTRALRDVASQYGQDYYASAVGEVNVVAKMKEVNAVIGGEGNGGVIYPASHYGRDALVGIALFLTYMAKAKKTVSEIKRLYTPYFISKNKIELTPEINVDKVLKTISERYTNYEVSTLDGVKIDFENEWVHLRKSNTEPIIRIYAEARSENAADNLSAKIMDDIREMINE